MHTLIKLLFTLVMIIGFSRDQCCTVFISQKTDIDEANLWPFRSSADDRVGFLNRYGQVVIPAQYSESRDSDAAQPFPRLSKFIVGEPFSDGRRRVKIGDKYGYLDSRGQLIVRPVFDVAWPFFSGLAVVRIGESCGYIDLNGDFVIAPIYDICESFSEGVAQVHRGNVTRFIRSDGKTAFEVKVKYDQVYEFSGTRALVRLNDRYGYIDMDGQEVIHPQFESAENFNEGLAPACIKQCNELYPSFGYIGVDGQWAIKPMFKTAKPFSEHMALVSVDGPDHLGAYGFIDHNGTFVIKPAFEKAKGFSEGLAAVYTREQGYVFIDHNGSRAFKKGFLFDANSFDHGIALVELGKFDGRIRIPGCENFQPKPPFPYGPERSSPLKCNTLLTIIKYGYIDKTGTVIFTGYISFAHEPGLPGPGDSVYVEPLPVDIEINTLPQHAKIYLIPLLAWNESKFSIPVDSSKLGQWLQSGYTPYRAKVHQDVYVVLVELGGKQRMRQKDINDIQDRKVTIDFSD